MKDIYCGTLVRLASFSPEVMAKNFLKWDRDTEMQRLSDVVPTQLWSEKKIKEYVAELPSSLFLQHPFKNLYLQLVLLKNQFPLTTLGD